MMVQPYLRPGSHSGLKLDQTGSSLEKIWFYVASTAQIPFFQEGIKPLLEVVSNQIQIQFNTCDFSVDVSVCLSSQHSASLLHDCRAPKLTVIKTEMLIATWRSAKNRIHLVARSIMSNKENVAPCRKTKFSHVSKLRAQTWKRVVASPLYHYTCFGVVHVDIACQRQPCYHDSQCNQALECRHSIVWAEYLQMAVQTHGLQDPIWAIRFACTSSLSPGSYIQASEKSYSMVRGGRTREAAALAWERQGPTPNKASYKNWAKSVLDNPAVVESTVKSSSSATNASQSKSECLGFFWMSFTGELDHRSGEGDPMCCHKEAPLEEGPVAVLGWVWFLQVCPVSQQCQTGSGWHRVQVCLWAWHLWTALWETCSWLHFRYCETIISCEKSMTISRLWKRKRLDNMSLLVTRECFVHSCCAFLWVSWNNDLFSIISDNYTLCIFDQYFLTKV